MKGEGLDQQHEQMRDVSASVLSVDELHARINSDHDQSRFQTVEQGGVFEYFSPEDLEEFAHDTRVKFLIVENNGDIVGIGKLKQRKEKEHEYLVSFLSVDCTKQAEGYGRKLLENIFIEAKKNGWTLVASPYSLQGLERLQPIARELSERYEVPFIDNELL